MNVKTLYKRVIEVLVDSSLLITKHKYDNESYGNIVCHTAMYIFVLESGEFNLYPSCKLYPPCELDRIHVKKYTYNRKSV